MSTTVTTNSLKLPSKPLQLPNKSDYVSEESKTKTSVRFLTFNVNSVSTVLQYYPMTNIPSSMRNLNTLFNWLEADIICLQELKISNPIISSVSVNSMGGTKLLQQHGILSDYKCFLTLPKIKKNYSGVGIYVKKSLPIKVVKVEEGITGFLPVNNTSINNYKITESNGKTGYLQLKYLNKNQTEIDSYRTSDSLSIGGYENLDTIFDNDIERALALDSQGRCIITEFNNGLIVIGCYIPANSIFSEEGLLFKMQYLKLIFQRIDNFQKAGKTVILMGDLNVCKDIIDREESLQVANKYFSNNTGNDIDPQLNYEFIKEKPERFFFNQQLMNSNFKIENNYKGSLLDSTRYIHPDRRKMYTCWNTLTNARSVNYGSRLDYILISKKHKNKILSSDILPEIQGSDHCPVFLDFLVSFENEILAEDKPLKFECKAFYKLINRDIMKMFGTKKIVSQTSSNVSNKSSNKVTKWKQPSSKIGSGIDGFFKKKNVDANNNDCSLSPENSGKDLHEEFMNDLNEESKFLSDDNEDDFLPSTNEFQKKSPSPQRKDFIQQKLESIKTDILVNKQISQQRNGTQEGLFVSEEENKNNAAENLTESDIKRKKLKELLNNSSNERYKNIPICKHNEKAIIKISQTKGKNKGKKFWCCNKPLVIRDINIRPSSNTNSDNSEYSCGFFKWVT
ncbi:hypothetical protein ACO0SA_004013 [Hanseniaspora valbyensis]